MTDDTARAEVLADALLPDGMTEDAEGKILAAFAAIRAEGAEERAAAEARIAELESERDEARAYGRRMYEEGMKHAAARKDAEARLAAARAQAAKMAEALEPFASVRCVANTFNRAELSDEDFRRARAALAAWKEQTK